VGVFGQVGRVRGIAGFLRGTGLSKLSIANPVTIFA
jgi:hypothetical protein